MQYGGYDEVDENEQVDFADLSGRDLPTPLPPFDFYTPRDLQDIRNYLRIASLPTATAALQVYKDLLIEYNAQIPAELEVEHLQALQSLLQRNLITEEDYNTLVRRYNLAPPNTVNRGGRRRRRTRQKRRRAARKRKHRRRQTKKRR